MSGENPPPQRLDAAKPRDPTHPPPPELTKDTPSPTLLLCHSNDYVFSTFSQTQQQCTTPTPYFYTPSTAHPTPLNCADPPAYVSIFLLRGYYKIALVDGPPLAPGGSSFSAGGHFLCACVAHHVENPYARANSVYTTCENIMPTIKIEPTKERPVPYDTSEEKPETLIDEMAVAANTVELQLQLGAQLDISEGDMEREKELLRAVTEARKPGPLKEPNTAYAAAAFLRTYGAQLALDAATARAAITNKLMEIANCGDPRYELKALELLGKHSDIGIFTDRSEITVNYKDADDLENAIKERVKRLLNATVVHEIPLGQALDDELGVAKRKPSLDAVLGFEDEEDAELVDE